MDSLKLLETRMAGDPPSRLDIVMIRVTFSAAVVLLMPVTSHPIVPLMSNAEGKVAVKGQAIMLGEAVPPMVSQVCRNEIETEKLYVECEPI
jgi:hypothetical protein